MLPKINLKKGKYIAVFKIRAFNKEVVKEVKFKISKKGQLKKKIIIKRKLYITVFNSFFKP